jgi:hypothetical protein
MSSAKPEKKKCDSLDLQMLRLDMTFHQMLLRNISARALQDIVSSVLPGTGVVGTAAPSSK